MSRVEGGRNQRTVVLPYKTSAGKCHRLGVTSMGCSQWLLLTAGLDPALICNGQAGLAGPRFVECPLLIPAVYRYFHSRSGGLCLQCVWHRRVSGIGELKVVFISTFSGCQPALLRVYLLLLDFAGSTRWSVRNWALDSHSLGFKYLSVR